MSEFIGFIVKDDKDRFWMCDESVFENASDANQFAEYCKFTSWDLIPVHSHTSYDPDRDRLINLAQSWKISVRQLAPRLDIHPDRLNNGGMYELIELALKDDDPNWIEEQILACVDDTRK